MNLSEVLLAEGRPDIVEALRPYRNDPDIFISFVGDVGKGSHVSRNWWHGVPKNRNVSGTKIGINPKTDSLTTPAAIYAYPLKEMWSAVERNNLPFAGERPFVYVLRAKAIVDLSHYSTQDFSRDLAKLKPLIAEFNPDTKELTKEWIALADVQSPGGYFWSIVENLAEMIADRRSGWAAGNATSRFRAEKSKQWVWNGLLRALGYSGFVDRKGEKIIHFIEPKQALFLSTQAFSVLDVLHNVRKGETIRESTNLLCEVDWRDKSRLVPILKANRGRWVHFSDVPKLGVNPNKFHKDPHGIYFYPTDWLLDTDSERLLGGYQYGTTMPYLFIADINLSAPGLVLSKVTWDDIERLASRNGWKETMNQQRGTWKAPSYATDKPGSFLWHFLDHLNQTKVMPWNASLRGVPFIYDDGNAIIHSNEPEQVVVFDRRLIGNVSLQDNPDRTAIARKKAEMGGSDLEWRRALLTIMQEVQTRYGGTIRFQTDPDIAKRPFDRNNPKAKLRGPSWPLISFEKDGKQFVLRASSRYPRSTQPPALTLDFRNHREVGDVRVASEGDMDQWSVRQIVSLVSQKVDAIAAKTTDLTFRPTLSEEQAIAFVKAIVPEAQTETTVDNSYEFMRVSGTHAFKIGRVRCEVICGLVNEPGRFKPSIVIQIGNPNSRDGYRIHGQARGHYTRDNPGDAVNDMLGDLENGLRRSAEIIGPDGYRWPKFYKHEWMAVLGYIVLQCGVTFSGRLADAFRLEIAQFEKVEDKAGFIKNMERVLDFEEDSRK